MDIYLSYASQDRDRAAEVASRLESEGFSVFWDRDLKAGERFEEVLSARMRDAAAVVVLWSPRSAGSAWVREEAYQALSLSKLVPAFIEPVELPLGFGQIQAVDISSGDGWLLLVAALRERVSNPRVTKSPRSAPRARERGQREFGADNQAKTVEEVGQQVEFEPGTSYKKPWRAGSTPIFIAHASGDKARIKPILEVLIRAGFPVWIDKPHLLALEPKLARKVRGIQFGAGDWKEQIRNAAHRANIVLAFWSNDAIDARREQFYYEVYMGLIQRKLCQCRIDDLAPSKIGMPFTFDQIADLSVFRAGAYHPELDFMIEGLTKFRRRLL